ncbi:hypothetical protein EJB05_26790, partial [Eragrostis curvula]
MWESLILHLEEFLRKVLRNGKGTRKTLRLDIIDWILPSGHRWTHDKTALGKHKMSEQERKSPEVYQDCSHWCLPEVLDSWNELLYAHILVKQSQDVLLELESGAVGESQLVTALLAYPSPWRTYCLLFTGHAGRNSADAWSCGVILFVLLAVTFFPSTTPTSPICAAGRNSAITQSRSPTWWFEPCRETGQLHPVPTMCEYHVHRRPSTHSGGARSSSDAD